MESQDEFEKKARRVLGLASAMNEIAKVATPWIIPENAWERAAKMQAILTDSFWLGAALDRHRLHVSTTIVASVHNFMGTSYLDTIQVVIEKERINLPFLFTIRQVVFECQIVARPDDKFLVRTGRRNYTSNITSNPFYFDPDGRGLTMEADKLQSWWSSEVLGWMNNTAPNLTTAFEVVDLPLSASPEMMEGFLEVISQN